MNDESQNPLASPLHCRRDAQGRILTLTREVMDEAAAREGGWEPIWADDPAITRFLQDVVDPATRLSLSDPGMGRVTEDLIDVLIDRGVMQFTDLPAAAQAKLLERRRSRVEIGNRLNLVADDGSENLLI